MIGDQPNPLEVNLNKMTPAERAKWDRDSQPVTVQCKCGARGKTIREYVERMDLETKKSDDGTVSRWMCGRCLHRAVLKEQAIEKKRLAWEAAQQAAQVVERRKPNKEKQNDAV